MLEELRIPYRTEFIPAHTKPAWFYLLHRENRTPGVNHNMNLVEDSQHIVSYLIQRFPDFFGAHTAYSSAHGGRKRLYSRPRMAAPRVAFRKKATMTAHYPAHLPVQTSRARCQDPYHCPGLPGGTTVSSWSASTAACSPLRVGGPRRQSRQRARPRRRPRTCRSRRGPRCSSAHFRHPPLRWYPVRRLIAAWTCSARRCANSGPPPSRTST